jgi:Protein of unknown function (DUF2934)
VQEFEREQAVQRHSHESKVGRGIDAFGHEEIAALAHQREARGCPQGSPEEDWLEALKELRSRAHSHA